MALNVTIIGYGNLGKSLEKAVDADAAFNLLGIVSRRNLDNPRFVPFKNLHKLAAKTDVALLALGSHNDIAPNAQHFANFHTVDSFDTHQEIAAYKQLMQHTKPNKISICAVGWDPGILSLVRALGLTESATFWGEGISQGHSNAARSVDGVLDAVSVTIPNSEARQNFLQGKPAANRHRRVVYVACVQADRNAVAQQICNLPHYFLGEDVQIVFCTKAEVAKIKQNKSHAGEVISVGDGYQMCTKLNVQCNTDFTAKVMLAYAKAVPQLLRDGFVGALDCLDIPLKYLASPGVI